MDIPNRYDLFISYSRRDAAFALRLREQLALAGKTCWIDQGNIAHGEEWWPTILAAIERSACFVCLVSPPFQQSRPCHAEAVHARALNKKIIQILHQDVASIPETVQHVTAIPWSPADAPETLAQLVLAAIERDFEYQRQRRDVLAKALEWQHGGRPRSLLLRGTALAAARILLRRCSDDRLAVEPQQQFVAASVSQQRRGHLLAGALGLAALLLALAAMVMQQVSRSRAQAAAATALAPSDPAAALEQGIAAMRSSATPEAVAALRSALLAAAPSRTLAAGNGWTTALPLARGRVALLGDDGQLRLCGPAPAACSVLARGVGPAAGVGLDPRGEWFAVASDRQVWYFDRAGVRQLYQGAVSGLLASADGAVIAVIRTAAPSLLLRGGVQVPLTLAGARPVALAPDGRRIALAVTRGQQRCLEVWSVDPSLRLGRRESASLRVQAGAVARFSPNGRVLAFAGDNEAASLWHFEQSAAPLVLPHDQSQDDAPWNVLALDFSADGRRLVSAGQDRTARVWEVASGRLKAILRGHAGAVGDVAFSPDGLLVATAGDDHAARLWSAADGRPLATMRGQARQVRHARFTPDGMALVTDAPDGTARVFPAGFGYPYEARDGGAAGIARSPGEARRALSPDGRWLALLERGSVKLVDRHGASGDWRLDASGTVFDVAFSPDSSRLVVTRSSPIVDVWNPATRQRAGFLIGHRDAVFRAVFNADGSLLATSSADGSALLWDWASARPLAELTGQGGFATSLAFSPAGDRIAVGGTDHVVRVYQCPVCGGAERMLAAAIRQRDAIRGLR
jgi:WD40 repeat protein